MLFSGTDNHLAGLGQMAETINRYPEVWKGKPGYEGYLNDRVAALPEILSDNGYRTLMSGKWHLGLTKERTPAARGFQESFALLPGAGNHYAYEPGTLEKPALAFLPPLYSKNDEFVDHNSLKDFYSSDYFATQLVAQLKSTDSDKPFFAYLPFTAPHWPLQAPREVIEKYKGFYDDGPNALREKRLQAQRELGLIEENSTIAPIVTSEKEWNELSDDEKKFSARTMEIYAAMVELLDKNVGRVVNYLEQNGQLDNTFVLFMSDNGAEGSILEAIPMLSANPPVKYFNNSYENIGNFDSFIWYGPRWAQASTAPSQLSKGYTLEGGIRCPLIVSYKPLINGARISKEFTTVMDILPTVLDLAGVPPVGQSFRGREVLIPKGGSWVAHLGDALAKVHSDTTVTGWELFGQRAVRRGNYKAVYIPTAGEEEADWELYDLSNDKGEIHNIAKQEPKILAELLEYWLKYEAETGVIVAPNEFAGKMRLFNDTTPRPGHKAV
ncbi:hypothetical protein TRVA0_025S00364 [Trichomonascus vanleenenianus]|uniref:uncharacterized protein n=1 Tax=Trichomonascus vanleenenianus TaxID=2268995 RepID=UPI003ECAD95C